jgi:hypothetical protein
MVDVYDIVIFLPLWLEHQIRAHAGGLRPPAKSPKLPANGPKLKELP